MSNQNDYVEYKQMLNYNSPQLDRYESKDGPPIIQTSNLTNVKLIPILEDINWPTVIKHFPGGSSDTLVVATLAGQIWLIDANKHEKTKCRPPGHSHDSKHYDDKYYHGKYNQSTYRKRLWLDINDKIGSLGLSSDNLYEERGLIGLEFDPNFKRNGIFYLYYSQLDRKTTSPSVVPVDPCKPSTQHQTWDDFSHYSHLNILEEWSHCTCRKSNPIKNPCRHRPKISRQLLKIKQPFHNNNGFNNLTWDHVKRSLLLITGDGGYLNDPFNLAQNNDFPHGKVLSIVPSAINYLYRIEPIAKLTQLPRTVKHAIGVISKGLRHSHGLFVYRPSTGRDSLTSKSSSTSSFNSHLEYFLTHNGQDSHEGLFRYDPRVNVQQTIRKKITNIGWSGWDNGQPTTTLKTCSTVDSNNSAATILPYLQYLKTEEQDTVIPTTRIVSWNLRSDFSKPLIIKNGDILRFLSTDGKYHNVYRLASSTSVNKTTQGSDFAEKLHDTSKYLDFTYQPAVSNELQSIFFGSTKAENMRFTVQVQPVKTIVQNIAKYMAAIQDNVSQSTIPIDLSTNISIMTYPDRILSNKLLPYFRYPHRISSRNNVPSIPQGPYRTLPGLFACVKIEATMDNSTVDNLSNIDPTVLDPLAYSDGVDKNDPFIKAGYSNDSKLTNRDKSNNQLVKPGDSYKRDDYYNHKWDDHKRNKYKSTQYHGSTPSSNRTNIRPTLSPHSKYHDGYYPRHQDKSTDTRNPDKYVGRNSTNRNDHDSEDNTILSISGTRITGVTLYTGGRGTTFGRGLIVSELNRKINNDLPSNLGHLFWVSLDPLSRRRFQTINVINHQSRPTYYVTLGSNETFDRLYVGVYHSHCAGKLKLGAIMEVVPVLSTN